MEAICPTHGRIENARPVYRTFGKQKGSKPKLVAMYCRCNLEAKAVDEAEHSLPSEEAMAAAAQEEADQAEEE